MTRSPGDDATVPLEHESGDVEREDTSSAEITEPFDPKQIRITTKQSSLDSIVARMQHDEIQLDPEWQRHAGLWTEQTQSRLIESLLLGIPLPAFYFDATNQDRWVVVDGLQRLTAIRRFVLQGELQLRNLEFLDHLVGCRYEDLPRYLQRRVREADLVCYLIDPGTPENVKFNIFRRINTGGLPLTTQEIRHALNHGPATQLLKDLAASEEFGRATGGSVSDARMAGREMVLRFMVFGRRPYGEFQSQDFDLFLSKEMAALNELPRDELDRLGGRFLRAMSAAHRILGEQAFRKPGGKDRRLPVNKALFEAWAVGLDALSDEALDQLECRRTRLLDVFASRYEEDAAFAQSVSAGTGDVRKVRLRFSTVETILAEALGSGTAP